MDQDGVKAQEFLDMTEFMTLAVTQENGKPWAVPVHVARREGWTFYWDSTQDAVHSQCIEKSPDVMLSMFRLSDGENTEFGLYMEASARLFEQLTDGRGRYHAIVQRAWINDEQHRKRDLKLTDNVGKL